MKYFITLVITFVIIFSDSNAQIPAGLRLWLKADQGIQINGSTVSKWVSSASVFAEQQATDSQPTLVSNAINGKPAVRFGGAQYMVCSSVYPVAQDYTVLYVVQLSNLGATNNVVSGNSHAIYSNPPRLLHGDFSTQALSSIALSTKPAVVTVRFTQNNQFGSVRVNGFPEDSAYVGTNTDSALYLGAFLKGNFLVGDIGEVMLYPRALSSAECIQAEDYLLNRFGIERLKPIEQDRTFSIIPQSRQFFARDANNGSSFQISGSIPSPDFTSIGIRIYRDQLLIRTDIAPLPYSNGAAAFDFTERIQSELREYKLEVFLKRGELDSVIAVRDSLVSGDVYLISGQSNTVYPGVSNQHEYVRTFGGNFSQNKRDTLWSVGTATQGGGGSTIGAWGLRLAELLMMNHSVPICIINGGVGGTTIEQNSRIDAAPETMNSIYGSMLYRVRKSNLINQAKAMFWYQGESNEITNYSRNFRKLYSDWIKDYPSLKKFYMVQIRPGCSSFSSHDQLRDVQRGLQDSLPNLEVMAAANLPGHDGCHYAAEGYTTLGNQLFRLVNRDFYGNNDTIGVSSPAIRKAFFTDNTRNELALVFRPALSEIVAQGDINTGGNRSLKDYFYLNDSTKITTLRTVKDTVFLKLASGSSATNVSYTPAVYYNGTQTIYEGPWLTNQRGVGVLTFAGYPITPKTVVSVVENNGLRQNTLSVMPNPASDILSITMENNATPRSVVLFDQTGRQVLQSDWRNQGSTISITTSHLASGKYTIHIETDTETATAECVIVR
jgi:hypothetical protein